MIIGKPMSGPLTAMTLVSFNLCHLEKHGLQILGWPCFLVYVHRPCHQYPAWHCACLTLEACCLNRHINLRPPARDKGKEILIWASLGTCPHSLSSPSPLMHLSVPFDSRMKGQKQGRRVKNLSSCESNLAPLPRDSTQMVPTNLKPWRTNSSLASPLSPTPSRTLAHLPVSAWWHKHADVSRVQGLG